MTSFESSGARPLHAMLGVAEDTEGTSCGCFRTTTRTRVERPGSQPERRRRQIRRRGERRGRVEIERTDR